MTPHKKILDLRNQAKALKAKIIETSVCLERMNNPDITKAAGWVHDASISMDAVMIELQMAADRERKSRE